MNKDEKGWKRHIFCSQLSFGWEAAWCCTDNSMQFSYSLATWNSSHPVSNTMENPSRQPIGLNSVQPGSTAHLGPGRVVNVMNCLADRGCLCTLAWSQGFKPRFGIESSWSETKGPWIESLAWPHGKNNAKYKKKQQRVLEIKSKGLR